VHKLDQVSRASFLDGELGSSVMGLTVHMANLCTKLEVSSCSRCRDISVGVKFQNVSRDPDHAPFWDNLSSAGWDLLPLIYGTNL